jgi:ribosomal protein L11 methyltransferase
LGNYLHILFHDIPKEEQEILIARFSDLAVEGFEEGLNFLSVFMNAAGVDEAAVQQILDGQPYRVTREIVPPKNWNEQWEKNFEPVVIDDFCAIRAHFHEPISTVRFEIVITPKMSFGTGHHATTWLVIKAMEQLDFTGKKVLDFGTGTGILAILAEKMGAKEVVAVDHDEWSIANAAENFSINGCSAIALEKADSPPATGLYDIILANVNRHVLLAKMAILAQQLQPGGVILLSGLLTGDRQELETSAKRSNLRVVEQKDRESWIYLLLTN